MDDLQRFKQTYITECHELLEDMEGLLLGIDEEYPDMEDLNAIFRCAHSIKGGAGAFSLTRISGLTHILEEVLDAMRDGKLGVTRNAIDVLLSSADILKTMVQAADVNIEPEEGIENEAIEHLNEVAGKGFVSQQQDTDAAGQDSQGNDENEISIYDICFKPNTNLFMTGNEPLLILRELGGLGEIQSTINTDGVPSFHAIEAEQCYVWWQITLETERPLSDIEEVFEFVEDDCSLTIQKVAGIAKQTESSVVSEDAQAPVTVKASEQHAKAAPAAKSIRVDVDKVDRLVNMVGELVITQAMIAAQSQHLPAEQHLALISGINQLSQHTIELQEAVMSVRMQPVKSVFSRMPRLVRDLSKKLDKNIRLEMVGENTELDKTVIEQLSDPLMHMIRNSVDHGIGTPEKRVASGKPEQGRILLSAEHRGGKIIITIADDGKGIDRERVLSIAKEKGLVADDAQLSTFEIDNLIFMPGFSTAQEVSDISGRGVGMDVVKRNIEALGGSVNVTSVPKKGSTFEVTLPLTLAILDGMVVRVGQEYYIIPIANIIETLRPKKEDVKLIADANDTINVRGEFISVMYLHRLFDIQECETDPSKALVILVESGSERFGLVVDELIGQQQVVIKSLEENSEAVKGISAATILGDGKVSLILDVSAIKSLNHDLSLSEYKEAELVGVS